MRGGRIDPILAPRSGELQRATRRSSSMTERSMHDTAVRMDGAGHTPSTTAWPVTASSQTQTSPIRSPAWRHVSATALPARIAEPTI